MKDIKDLLILRFCPLFRDQDEAGLEEIFSKIKYTIRKYEKGKYIALAGDTYDSLYIPLKGSVRGEMVDSAGRCLKIEDIKAPMPLAIAFIFGRENTFPVNVISNSEVSLLKIPKKDLLQLMMSDSAFLHVFLNLISNRVQFLTEKISFLSFNTIKEKLAHYLIKNEKDGEVIFTSSHEKMAELFGITRPSFSRGLKELKAMGAIDFKRRDVSIIDKSKLVAVLEAG